MMELPDVLRRHGSGPKDFLMRAGARWVTIKPFMGDIAREHNLLDRYVDLAIYWALQPEGWEFWSKVDKEWRAVDSKARWPALELAMERLGPLEAELLEVRDGVT
jgi:hypothetical protein